MHLDLLFWSIEKTERCGKGERILPAVTATSTASRATSYVNAANTTSTGTHRYIDRTTCQNSNTQVESTVQSKP